MLTKFSFTELRKSAVGGFKKSLVLVGLVALLTATVSFGGWEVNFPYPYGTASTVFFISEQIGFCGGQSGAIFRTGDAGQNWEEVLENTEPQQWRAINAICFPDSRYGWAVGAICGDTTTWEGAIYFSQDTGKTWVLQDTIPYSFRLYDVEFVDSLYGWCVGKDFSTDSSAVICHTSNGGQNWTKQDASFNGAVLSIDFINRQNGWATGYGRGQKYEQGVLLHTINGGNLWSIKAQKPCTLYKDIQFLDFLNGFMCGYYCNYPDTPIVYQGFIWKTANGGLSWDIVFSGPDTSIPIRSDLFTLDFIDTLVGWVGGSFGPDYNVILHTTDGGNSWTYQSVGDSILDLTIYSICALSPTNVWAAEAEILDSLGSQAWSILHYTGQAVKETITSQKQRFEIYPNPCLNSIIEISCHLPVASHILFEIYDIIGSKIATFEEERLAGKHKIVWNVRGKMDNGLRSGIYFLRMTTNNGSITKKFILLH